MQTSARIHNTPLAGFQYGGKADKLFVLKRLGFSVPHFVVIPKAHLEAAGASEIAETAALTSDYFKKNGGANRWAVRSSAPEEDGRQYSFAGQFESFLHVGQADLAEKIAAVRNSACSERVAAYRRAHGLTETGTMAVIVQEMIEPEVAGVAFGAHPVSGDPLQKVVSAVFGLGEGLVDGLLDADTYTLHADGRIAPRIVRKEQCVAYDAQTGNGTCLQAVAPDLQEKSTLTDAQVLEIGQVLRRLEQHFGHPQDVEFAYSKGHLYLLQTRPLTTRTATTGTYRIWDNSNIVESYPGLTLPLTFSFIRKMYEAVYRGLLGLMGVTEREIDADAKFLADMIGLVEGRVYYNLLNWYKALALLPGYALNAEFMERMMGVKERFVLEDRAPHSRFWERLRVLNLLRCMIGNLLSLPRMSRRFEADFEVVVQEYTRIDFQQKNAEELLELYRRYEETLLCKWKAPLVNDFFAMIYFGVLQKLAAKYQLNTTGNLHNDLLCGAGDIVSSEPVHLCLKLAVSIQNDPDMRRVFVDENPRVLAELYKRRVFSNDVLGQIDDYLARWGSRCGGELKLETVTYRMRPALFLELIQSYVRQGVQAKDRRPDLELRGKAETAVRECLRGKPLQRLLFSHVLTMTRRLVSARENLRFARTRAYDVVRSIFCALGERFFESGLLAAPRDIFYLTQAEAFDCLQGTSVNGDLKKLVALRKQQYRDWETSAAPPAERFATRGLVYAGNDFRDNLNPTQASTDCRTLIGLGCCPGRVRGKVRVLRAAHEAGDLEGDILVAQSTDPGWVTLFPTASAILVEKGSLLSHSAIVAREMGIPCIVGITGLLQNLKTGDWVEMDGGTGEVRIQMVVQTGS
jgi:rifampicin phosphotransferase